MLAHDLYRYILMSFSMHCLCICTLICCAVSTLANALVLYLEAFRHACIALHGIFPGGASRQGEVPWCVPCQQGGEIGVWSKGESLLFGVSVTLGREIVESSSL